MVRHSRAKCGACASCWTARDRRRGWSAVRQVKRDLLAPAGQGAWLPALCPSLAVVGCQVIMYCDNVTMLPSGGREKREHPTGIWKVGNLRLRKDSFHAMGHEVQCPTSFVQLLLATLVVKACCHLSGQGCAMHRRCTRAIGSDGLRGCHLPPFWLAFGPTTSPSSSSFQFPPDMRTEPD